MKLRDKNILITGGAGFIGSHLVDRLIKERPAGLIVVDNFFLGAMDNLSNACFVYPALKIFRMDASHAKKMQAVLTKNKIDIVFNLAVIPLPTSLRQPGLTFNKNVLITSTLCELCREDYFETLIHFSSSEVYGNAREASIDEEHPLDAITPYAASKAASDQLVISYHKTFDMSMMIVRPFNTYGPRQNDGRYAGVIPQTITNLLSGKQPVIFGTGHQTRDFTYINDTVNMVVDICKYGREGEVYNIASGNEISIQQVVDAIQKHINSKILISYKPFRIGDVARHYGDISKLKQELIASGISIHKFTHQIFEEGIKETVDWYVAKNGLGKKLL